MPKRILFSPIGGTDPISTTDGYDGSMLHICRHYKPDVVYLYLSNEMLENHKREGDNRYVYCIERLGEFLKHSFEVRVIERPNLIAVHDYNYFYDDFHSCLLDIQNEMDDGDELYANMSSGTPSMKSALLVLGTIAAYPYHLIQVSTPEKKMNEHIKDKQYDPEFYWEANGDNEESAENRCKEVMCPNLEKTLQKDLLKKYLLSYNYPAAVEVANMLKDSLSEQAYDLIVAAKERSLLNMSEVSKYESKYNDSIIPVRTSSERQLFEYALALKLKLNHHEYGDFIRAISPLLADLYEMILDKQCGIQIRNYCKMKSSGPKLYVKKLVADAVGNDILNILNAEFHNSFKDSNLAASNMEPILRAKLTNVGDQDNVHKMRLLEGEIRNLAAHEIVTINEVKLEKTARMLENEQGVVGMPKTFEQVMKMIQKLVALAKISNKDSDWNSYDLMNQTIIDIIG